MPVAFAASNSGDSVSFARTYSPAPTSTFRPPYGKKLLELPYYLDQHDRKTIMWDVEPDSVESDASARSSNV